MEAIQSTLEKSEIGNKTSRIEIQITQTGKDIFEKLQNGLSHQERIRQLKKLSIERLVDVNNTLYCLIINRNPRQISQVESELFMAIGVAIEEHNNIISLEAVKVDKGDITGWRRIEFLGISN